MVKCDYCGKEVDLPFTCPYCGGHFCAEHRLPENHECLFLPKERFWYQRQRKVIERTEQMERKKPSGLGKALEEAPIAVLVIAILIGASILAATAIFTENPAVVFFVGFGILFLVFFIISLSVRKFR